MRPPRALVVWCPDWPVIAIGLDAATPAAVVSHAAVVACSAAARMAGVRRGQRLRDAQRHCPDLLTRLGVRTLGAFAALPDTWRAASLRRRYRRTGWPEAWTPGRWPPGRRMPTRA